MIALLALAYFGHWNAIIWLLGIEVFVLTPMDLIINKLMKDRWL